ncbi:TetR/AcrR family transcriptional regulator [Paenibacillus sp. OAS669]|uniref:TetR/AcrR family transcriptional regulator n=1 Tax=Paenibacillus sp. OAS669 TaxID=2663821 RepID=UPI00178AB816|nr:TetR/AcrR family transcriptional regulator [Paenibacillus sp. OAS669]MBE1441593.1 AcrR family transcriptional regulator [Paenibacillus sp. OAS669]
MQDKSMNASLRKLLDIAEEMILEKGCRATTLQEIADRGGLTKGAIYHYVKSKDELFGLILEAGIETTNQRFYESVSRVPEEEKELEAPLDTLTGRLGNLNRADNAANLIFIYLLSQKDKPAVASILSRYYESAVQASKKWIEFGQQHGVIPSHIDAEKTARMFALFKNGLQVQHILSPDRSEISDKDIYEFMLHALGGGRTQESGNPAGRK